MKTLNKTEVKNVAGGEFSWSGLGAATAGGAVVGGAMGAVAGGVGAGPGAIGGAVGGGGGYLVRELYLLMAA
jgi:hypothetical protein